MKINLAAIKRPSVTLTATMAGLGTALVAALTSACCVTPVLATLMVGVLGASGVATAAGLKPYSPYLFGGSLVSLGFAFWAVYRPAPSQQGGTCRAAAGRGVKLLLWTSAGFWIVAATGTYLLLRG